jgi:tetratricopeptide (TPR) repeat protein
LDIGVLCAKKLEKWQQALEFNREAQQIKRERGAPSLELARLSFIDYFPLLNLHQYDEAERLLRHCRDVFERENAINNLGVVISALADLENRLGRPMTAQQFEKTALRYTYAAGNPDDAAVSHFNISNYVTNSRGDWHDALVHRLAAALIVVAMQSGRAASGLAALVRDLRDASPRGPGCIAGRFRRAVRDRREDRRRAVSRADRASCRRAGQMRGSAEVKAVRPCR